MNAISPIPLRDLHFDPENPRLPNFLKQQEDEAVLKYLLLECNLVELMLSIGEHGFFEGEPLLVVKREKGGFTVVEGNRRLGALKLLAGAVPPVRTSVVEEARASVKVPLDYDIPTMQFPSRDAILSYLGFRHITGIKEWDALAKARYLKQLRSRHKGSNEEVHQILAKEIGSRASTVAKLLTGLKVLEVARDNGILAKIKLEEDDIQFSLLTTGLSYRSISNFVGLESPADVEAKNLNIDHLSNFFSWVFEKSHGPTVLGESRNFEKLARIVTNDQALIELRRGVPIETADLYTEGPLEAFRNLLREAEERLENASATIKVAEGLNENDLQQAERVRKAAIALHGGLSSLISPQK